jgi:Outer membrane protein beta-barrel domain
MKRLIFLLSFTFALAVPSAMLAQSSDHVEVGVFADYMNFSATDPHINFVGVGGRAAFNVHPNIQLEAEMAYDFGRNFTSVFSNGINTQFVNINLRPLTALFGPKFQTSSGPFRAYVTGKVGLVNFSVSGQTPPAGFVGAIGGIETGDTRFAMYPGGGVEGFWGPIGLRAEVGDEIYFNNGTHNNLKVTLGPVFRF